MKLSNLIDAGKYLDEIERLRRWRHILSMFGSTFALSGEHDGEHTQFEVTETEIKDILHRNAMKNVKNIEALGIVIDDEDAWWKSEGGENGQ